MLRCYISDKNHLKEWFTSVRANGFSTSQKIATHLNVSTRTLTDWQRAKFGIPQYQFRRLEKIAPYRYEDILVRDDLELKKISARLGGIARSKKGPLGSIESRRKGGYASLATHRLRKTGLFMLKECNPYPHTKSVAELTGIIIGDGHLSPGQLEITLDARERPYAEYVQKLLQAITKYKPILRNRTDTVIAIYLSGKEIIRQFHLLGIEYGNKTKKQNYIPGWILEREEFSKAFIKGIFDTDGCLYIDRHKIGTKIYRHWGISQASNNQIFLEEVGKLLIKLGFHPTTSTKHRIILRRQEEVHLFMDVIRPENAKHVKSYPKLI